MCLWVRGTRYVLHTRDHDGSCTGWGRLGRQLLRRRKVVPGGRSRGLRARGAQSALNSAVPRSLPLNSSKGAPGGQRPPEKPCARVWLSAAVPVACREAGSCAAQRAAAQTRQTPCLAALCPSTLFTWQGMQHEWLVLTPPHRYAPLARASRASACREGRAGRPGRVLHRGAATRVGSCAAAATTLQQ